jgi:type IV secretion system protein VirB11
MTAAFAPDDAREAARRSFLAQMEPLLALGREHPTASELFIDGEAIRLSFGDREQLYAFADFPGLTPRAVQGAGRNAAVFADVRFGPHPPARPYFSVMIPPGLRVTYAGPPIAAEWHVAIRFLRANRLRLEDYVAQGVMTAAQRDTIEGLLAERRNLIVSGGTGSGKTTLLQALLAEVSAERLLVLEDTPELNVAGRNVVQLRTTESVSLAELLRLSLRTTPQRIVVGEVRGPEALELVRAMNTGHDGTLCTLHSNGAAEALRRLHTLVAEAQPSFPMEGVVAAVNAVVQLTGRGASRRLAEIWQVSR